MPINTDLNIAPYFDDFDTEKQFYRILYKPGYAVQARELTQLQSILQNQVETFGDNIFQEGSIVKGCTFTNLDKLEYVKVRDKASFDVKSYVSKTVKEVIGGVETDVDIVYELEGEVTGLKAKIIESERGFETRPPDLNTFFINYLKTNETSNYKVFQSGENLKINQYRYIDDALVGSTPAIQTINVSPDDPNPTGKAFGIQSSAGVVFQKGNFIYTEPQTLIVEKYSNQPDGKSVGYEVKETVVSSLQDSSLFDNANGSTNENAPGADRLKLTPVLVVKTTTLADTDADFFTLIRYVDGNAVQLRDVSQYNALGDEMARRTYEESGNYIVERFNTRSEKRSDVLKAVVSPGVAYVKGYRVESGGEQSFTIDQVSNTEILQNQPVSIEYGSYVDVTGINGTIDLQFTEADLEEGGTVIGKTFIRNLTQDRIYLFGSRITTAGKSFADVDQIDSVAGTISIAADSKIKEQEKAPMIFPTGVFSVKSTSDITVPIRSAITGASITGNQITLTNGGGVYNYDVQNDDVVVVDSLNVSRSVTSAVAQANDSELLITVGGGATGTATVYANRNIQLTTPYAKTLKKPYIKVAYSGGTTKYSLGFPDVIRIESIVDSQGTDYTDSFRLRTNQKDGYYDLSYMEYIAGRPQPSGTITIKLWVFELNASTGSYFFTINSYPIDDDTETLPNDKVRSQDLVVYSTGQGRDYNLRECVDFRPYADKDTNANYNANSPGTAPTISAAADGTAPTFSRSDYIVPAVKEAMVMDIESYNARIDLVTIDSFGSMEVVQGSEAQDPGPPKIDKTKMVISEIFIPGYPALSAFEADRQKKPAYAVRTRSKGVKRFTMNDIAAIDNRVERMEYYITLNSLEQSVENLNVLDENGLTRFKNGYLAETFNNMNFADTNDPEYNAAVPFDTKTMTPPVITFPLDLKYKSSTASTLFPTTAIADTGTLSRNAHVQLLKQPYATNIRNCVSNFYDYRGTGGLSPSHDFGVDTVANPVPATIDLATPFQDFADAIQEFVPLTGTTRVQSLGNFQTRNWLMQTQQVTTSSLDLSGSTTNPVGDFVSNVAFNPFIRPQSVKIYMAGLRPNTRHYFFFDGQNIDANVTPGTDEDLPRLVEKFGQAGNAVETDDNGVLRAVFDIPAETFYVGERKLEIHDINQYDSVESAGTSGGSISFHAYNVEQEKTTLQTRVPEIDFSQTVTTRNVALRPINRGDPLAQTFFIKEGMGQGSNTVMISKVDLYFNRKSNINGTTVEIREVVNGYPGNRIIPFSQTHLKPSQVNVSADASVVTTVDFEAPVRLETETEYCIVIRPDANDPNYLVYTSKVGGTDLTPGDTNGQSVVADWGDGILFTSTNNKAWKSYQDEDLKFTLYRHDFNSTQGSITLTNNDHEFFTLLDWNGQFTQGEYVYQLKDNVGGNDTISISVGSKTITGTDLDDTYAAGDYILIEDSGQTRKDVFKIAEIVSASEMTTVKKASFAGATGRPVVLGKATYHNFRRPETLYIEESSATSTFPFEVANTVYGLDSGTEADISSIDDINLSYVQPIIQRTNDSASRTTIKGRFVDTQNTNNYYEQKMKFGDANFFAKNGVVLYSKSNDLSSVKPFEITIDMTGTNTTSSPLIDIETSLLMANQYRVDNSGTARYISKVVELAEDLDAEDMRLYLTGYRPEGSDIKVYIRPQHAYDSEAFDTIDWIELEKTEGERAYSSTSNPMDYREFVYEVPEANKNGDGALFYTSGAGGDFVGYRKFAIRIDLLSPNIHRAPNVADFRAIALT
jgi:hypothetical protein